MCLKHEFHEMERIFTNFFNRIIRLLCVLCVLIIIPSCSGSFGPGMPENRPKDFVVQYYTSGGMLNLGENIYISGDSCRYTEHYNNAVSRTKFTISNSLFDSLYKIFRDNK